MHNLGTKLQVLVSFKRIANLVKITAWPQASTLIVNNNVCSLLEVYMAKINT